MKFGTCGKDNGVSDDEVILTSVMRVPMMEMMVVMAGKITKMGVMKTVFVMMVVMAVMTRVAGWQR